VRLFTTKNFSGTLVDVADGDAFCALVSPDVAAGELPTMIGSEGSSTFASLTIDLAAESES
jgi:hypothetical protein